MSQYSQNPYYQGGGGGYLAGNSPFGNGDTPGSARRKPASHSLRPVTIKQVLNATQAYSEAEFVIDDIEVAQVTLVAQVMSIQKQTTNVVYLIDDGTGRIEARHWVDSTMEEETGDNEISEDMYVRVMGNIKSFGNKRYVNATHQRAIKDAHEIEFHLLEAAAVKVTLERGPHYAAKLGSTAVKSEGGASAYTAQSNAAVNDQWSGLPPLERDIVRFIANHPHTDEGVNVGAIARAVGGAANSISEALDNLLDGGHIYTTIDESHYAVSE
ncbi:replication protein A, subunit RPA32 [Panus rudis PR-1116 ss-1]|nr:replication protein A, subunit RPA32 [Panus rudis PR-1116 ss-1]